MDHKKNIIEALDKLRKKEIAEKETWKARAYTNAIKSIKTFDGQIISIDDIKDLPGVGKKIHDKIVEIIDTGKLRQAEEYNSNEIFISINDLTRVHAIGPSKAKDLVEQHKIKNIADLQNNLHLLNKKQIMGLKYLQDFELRIPRKEMDKHALYIIDNIKTSAKSAVVEIVGSYRRGAKDSGDIDVLVTGDDADIKSIVDKMQVDKYIHDTFALGNKKYMGVCKVRYGRHFRRIDILVTDKHEFPFAQLYFTGDQSFNVEMRNIALGKGYSLSEYGLRYTSGAKKGQFIDDKFTTEESIFKFLNLQYVLPKDRKTGALKT